MAIPAGMSIDKYIADQKIVVDGIMVSTMSIFASCFDPQKAEWLAHILNVEVMGTKFDHYRFITVPDTSVPDVVNVAMLDTNKPQEKQVVGFAEPAEDQPILQKYITQE